MRELVHVDPKRLGRLICDEPSCGHQLKEPMAWGPWLLGFPCPKCGSNMLTQEDYEKTEKTMKFFRWLNKWFGWLGKEYNPDDPKNVTMSFRHHGNRTTIERE